MAVAREPPAQRGDRDLAGHSADPAVDAEKTGTPGKRTLTGTLTGRVFRRAADRTVSPLARRFLLRAASRSGRPLPDALLRRLERALGKPLGDVRIHVGEEAAAAATAVAAKAYTIGKDIYFAEGAYDPDGVAGQHLLAHEVAHTVQTGGAAPASEAVSVSDPSDAVELAAESFADSFARAPIAREAQIGAPSPELPAAAPAPVLAAAPATAGVVHASDDPNKARKDALEAKHGLRPKQYGGFFNNSNRAETLFAGALPQVVTFINEKFRDNGYPDLSVTSAELATNFIMEGGFHALDEDNADEIEGFGELGIDTLVDNFRQLKPWLHESVIEMVDDPKEIARATNERNEVTTSIGYLDIVTGMYASAGMYAYSKALASRDLADKKSPMSKMPEEGAVFWSTMYFNAGRGTARGRLKRPGGPGADLYKRPYRGPAGRDTGPHHNAALRASSFELLRDTVNFDLPDHGAFPQDIWGVQRGSIALGFETASLEDKELSVKVEYSVDRTTFSPCTGEAVTAESGGREGASHEFTWDSAADLPDKTGIVMVRITSSDGTRAGVPQSFPVFVANGPLDLSLELVSAPRRSDPQPSMTIRYPELLEPTTLKLGSGEHPLAPFITGPHTVTIPLGAVELDATKQSARVILRSEPTGVDSNPLDVRLDGSDASHAFAFGMAVANSPG